MVLLCVFIGIAAPAALLGFGIGVLITSVDQDAQQQLLTQHDSERWVSIV